MVALVGPEDWQLVKHHRPNLTVVQGSSSNTSAGRVSLCVGTLQISGKSLDEQLVNLAGLLSLSLPNLPFLKQVLKALNPCASLTEMVEKALQTLKIHK